MLIITVTTKHHAHNFEVIEKYFTHHIATVERILDKDKNDQYYGEISSYELTDCSWVPDDIDTSKFPSIINADKKVDWS